MSKNGIQKRLATESVNESRRSFMNMAGAGFAVSALGFVAGCTENATDLQGLAPLRWGIVGTGGIANSAARTIAKVSPAILAGISSRSMEKASEFAERHGAARAFDSWQELVNWDGVDAIYVATPTSVREGICVAAANAGNHVLGEKPFFSLPSLRRITAACRDNGVAFMDGTRFSHHPRTLTLKSELDALVGKRRTVDSVFQFSLADKQNIRLQPNLEPMGAIGDAGWYNMRAIIEYLGDDVKLTGSDAFLRRDPITGAVIGASGVLAFADGSSSTWNCGFDAGAVIMSLRIDGEMGSVDIENFLSEDGDGSASYRFRTGGWSVDPVDESTRIESSRPGGVIMFENFAKQVHDSSLRDQWMRAAERTQELLDAVWQDALENESARNRTAIRD